MSAPPLWFLDVDGVLNAVPRRRSGAPESDVWDDWTSGSATADGMAWPIWFSPELMAGIASLHRARLVDVQWLTTWGHEANDELRQLLRLPVFTVAGTSPDRPAPDDAAATTHGAVTGRAAPDPLTGTWWKFDVVRVIVAGHPGRRIVWTDDDLRAVPDAEDWMREHTTCLLIAPDLHEGLTPAHLEAIRRFSE